MSLTSLAARASRRQAARAGGGAAPPLILWLRAAALLQTLLFLVFGYLLLEPPIAERSTVEGQAEKIESFKRDLAATGGEEGRGPVLVLLGSSRINYALRNDPTVWRRVAEEAGVAAPRLLSLPVVWGSFQRFSPIADALLQLPPGILVLQSELLTDDLTVTARFWIALRYLSWLSGQIPGDWMLWDPEFELDTFVCPGQIDAPARLAESRTWIGENPSAAGPRAARDFLRRSRAAGWRVIVTNLPKSDALERLAPSFGPAIASLATELREEGVEVLPFQDKLGDALFCDAAHLTPEGGAIWLRWLLSELRPR